MAWNRGFRPDGLDSVTTQNEGEHHWNELCGVALMGLSACDQDTLKVCAWILLLVCCGSGEMLWSEQNAEGRREC